MINDAVISALSLEYTANGKLDVISTSGKTATPLQLHKIYAVDTREIDDTSMYDEKLDAAYVACIYLPYKLFTVVRHQPKLNMGTVVRYAIDFCHAHVQSGRSVFLTLPDAEHATLIPNNAQAFLKAANLSFDDHLYRYGLGGAMELLNRIAPNRTVREAREFLEQLSAALSMRDDLQFETDDTVVILRDNTAFRCNRFATTEDDVWQMLPPVTPEDRILWQSRLPVAYDPTITSHDLLDKTLEGWSGPKGSDKWWRNLEANFGSLLLPTVKYQGLVFNIAQGGAGMSTMNDLRVALFGSSAIYSADLDDFESPFGRGYMAGVRAVIIDEMPEGKISNKALGTIKSLVSGVKLSGKIKFSMDTLDIQGMAIIFNGNNFLRISQREAAKNSSRRRFIPVSHNKIFDDANIADASKRDADPELSNRLVHDPEALSYLLNLALQAAARIVVRHGYTPVDEDLAILNTELASQNIIDQFIESIGGIFGEKCPYELIGLSKPGHMFPAEIIASLRVLRLGTLHTTHIVDYDSGRDVMIARLCELHVHLCNEFSILYDRYKRYCAEIGEQAVLNGQSFRSELAARGYVQVRGPRNPLDPHHGQPQLIVPSGYGKSQKDLTNLVNSSLVEYVSTDYNPEPLPVPTPKSPIDDSCMEELAATPEELFEHGGDA